jgi:hypothetical protein
MLESEYPCYVQSFKCSTTKKGVRKYKEIILNMFINKTILFTEIYIKELSDKINTFQLYRMDFQARGVALKTNGRNGKDIRRKERYPKEGKISEGRKDIRRKERYPKEGKISEGRKDSVEIGRTPLLDK